MLPFQDSIHRIKVQLILFGVLFLLLFIVLPTAAQSPGGVNTNLSLWLKADAGITTVGGNVSAWADQSGNGNNATQGTAANRPAYVTNDLNGNPVLDFITDDRLDGAAGFNTQEYFLIIKPEYNYTSSSAAGIIIGFDQAYQSGFSSFLFGDLTARFTNEVVSHLIGPSTFYGAGQLSTSVVYNEPVLFNCHNNAGATNQMIKANGVDIVTNTVFAFENRSNANYRIGHNYPLTANAAFDGKVAEIISYSASLSDQNRRSVTTYLALKYGITINLTSHSYQIGGTDLYNYTSYANSIIGVGRHDASALNLVNSKSVNNGTIVRIQSPSNLDNNEYLILGNNGAAITFVTSNVPVGAVERLERIWRIAETGDVGTITISFDVTTLGINTSNSTINLFVAPSAATMPAGLSTANVIVGGVFSKDADNRDILTFTNVDFSNGQYFTIGGDVQTNSPGGTSVAPSLWLRADQGVTQTSNNVSKWTDYGGGGNDVIQGNPAQQPVLVPNAFNFNPAIEFSSDFMDGARGFFTQDYFMVIRPNLAIDGTNSVGMLLGYEPNGFSGFGLGNYSNAGTATTERMFHAIGTATTGYHRKITAGTYATNVTIVNSRNNAGNTDQEILVNGLTQTVVSNSNSTGYVNSSNQPFRIGNNFTSTAPYNGLISEIISFNTRLSNTDRRNVETYLALKYGLSLDISALGYTSSGSTIYGYTGYPNNIAGIGQDLNNSFRQLASRGGIVGISNPSSINDGEYLVWGQDAGSATTVQTSEVPAGISERLNAEWQVDLTGTPGTVTMKFLVSGIDNYANRTKDPSSWSLLLSSDNDFTTINSSFQGASFSGDTIIFTNVSLTDGYYFTLGVPPVIAAPGTGMTVWLKANAAVYSDAGTTLATNGQTVQQWNNSVTATLTNVNQGTAANRPTYNTNRLNGYPIISFDGTNDRLVTANLAIAAVTGVSTNTVFMVLNPRASGGTYLDYRRNNNNSWLALNNNAGNVRYFYPRNSTPVSGGDFTNQNIIISAKSESSTNSLWVSGNLQNTSNYGANTLANNDRPFYLGARNTDVEFATVDIAEVLVYSTALSAANQLTVETYLATKYGLTKALPYQIAGVNLYNDASYANNIAGIGSYATMGLTQQSSRSEVTGSIIRVFNPSGLSNNEYLFWGNNNASANQANVVTTGQPVSISQALARTWRVVETGDVGTVSLSMDLTGLGFTAYQTNNFRLILDTDNNRANGIFAMYTPVSFANNLLTFQNIEFSGASYIYLGTGIDLNSDSDGDGIPDYFELANGSNPLSADSPVANGAGDTGVSTSNGPAGDGISDGLEFILVSRGATAPVTRQTDTDRDGIPDYLEVLRGSDPFNSSSPLAGGGLDADNDGLPDLVELIMFLQNNGVNISLLDFSRDTDGDGIPDDVETQLNVILAPTVFNSTNANQPVASGNLDSNGNGTTNAVEWLLGQINLDISSDTDNDGVPDYFEYLNGFASNDNTAPVNPGSVGGIPVDTDGDGVSDAMEAALLAFGVPAPITATSDADRDGIPDYIEVLTYSDPLNIASPGVPSLTVRALQADYQAVGAACLTLSGYKWINVTDNLGNIVYSINPVGNNLGATCWAVRVLSGSANVRNNSEEYILNRNWWISPTTQPTGAPVYIRFYANNVENTDLQSKISLDGFTTGAIANFVADSIRFAKIGGVNDLDPFVTGGTRQLIKPSAIEYGSTATIYTIGVSSFSSFVPFNNPEDPNDPLPVEWLRFVASSSENGVVLEWSTATEINNFYFEIQRSIDGYTYEPVGRVAGNGNADWRIDYQFTDTGAPSGVSYYRIRQVDFDGQFEYSEIVRVSHIYKAQSLSAILYPNPTQSDNIRIKVYSGIETSDVVVLLTDIRGKQLYKNTLPVSQLGIEQQIILSKPLKPGMYVLSIRQSGQSESIRLIIE